MNSCDKDRIENIFLTRTYNLYKNRKYGISCSKKGMEAFPEKKSLNDWDSDLFSVEYGNYMGESCPAGYKMQGGLCIKTSRMDPIPPGNGGSQGTAGRMSGNVLWGSSGTFIMNPGYAIDGNGAVAKKLTTPKFWLNGTSPGIGANTTYGKVNETAVWVHGSVNGEPYNEYIGFSRKFYVPSTRRYYVGLAADNKYSLKLNGTTILSGVQSLTSPAIGSNFRGFILYPVDLVKGDNYIEMTAMNISGPVSNPGALCAEIYDNTPDQIAAATDNSHLKILFSTKGMDGVPFDIGESIGYRCQEGWSLSETNGVYFCIKNQYAEPIVSVNDLDDCEYVPQFPDIENDDDIDNDLSNKYKTVLSVESAWVTAISESYSVTAPELIGNKLIAIYRAGSPLIPLDKQGANDISMTYSFNPNNGMVSLGRITDIGEAIMFIYEKKVSANEL